MRTTEIKKKEFVIGEIMENYMNLYDQFREITAEITTLLIAVKGASYFDEDTERKVNLASEAVRIQLRKDDF